MHNYTAAGKCFRLA